MNNLNKKVKKQIKSDNFLPLARKTTYCTTKINVFYIIRKWYKITSFIVHEILMMRKLQGVSNKSTRQIRN